MKRLSRDLLKMLATTAVLMLLFASAVMAQDSPEPLEPVGELDANCVFTSRAAYGLDDPIAQTFVAEKTGKLTSVMIRGGTSEAATISINAVNNLGVPTDSALATTPLAPSKTEDYWSTAVFPYKSAPSVMAGRKYAIVLEGSAFGWEGASANYCSDGAFYQRFTDGWQSWSSKYGGDYDLIYRTFVSPPDTIAPTGTVKINNGATRTTTRLVTLNLSATDPSPGYWEPASGVTQMRFRNVGTDTAWSAWQPYKSSRSWYLTPREGTKRVAAQFKDAAGNRSTPVYDYIIFRR